MSLDAKNIKGRKKHSDDDRSDEHSGSSGEDDIGPSLTDAVKSKTKKRKLLDFEDTFLRNIPKGCAYEKSFMHRDHITHVEATSTDFIITASADGHVKFWKKQHGEGIEFVKQFRSHLGKINDTAVNCNGTLLATVSDDKTVKVFDITNFDMINMIRLDFRPNRCECIHDASDSVAAIAVADGDSPQIQIFDGRGSNEALKIFDKMHTKPVIGIKFIFRFGIIVSTDTAGMIEYWTGHQKGYAFPFNVLWKSKMDTDLFDHVKAKTHATSLIVSPNGHYFATYSLDRKIRIFKVGTGKLYKVLDESLSDYIANKARHNLSNTEFNRRIAVERDMEKTGMFQNINLCFDETSNFLLYATMLGIKLINLKTNVCVRLIGKSESLRFVRIALCQAVSAQSAKSQGAVSSIEMEASDNPALQRNEPDPMLIATAYKKNRFYIFTNSEPFETTGTENDRDVFNEKPLKEDLLTAVDTDSVHGRLSEKAVVHTTMGDVHCQLYTRETPKSVENFCTHARQGYFNGHIFHRVIKAFMIQTGDPTGTGSGGESIWGGDFEDEFNPSLKHDRPYMLSMANAGPNTNGSQFFITLVPTPWLDNKHTIFGRVTKGMEVVQAISKVKTNPRTDKPYDEISIISVTLK